MAYVEWLRVRNVLRVTLIVAGVAFLLAGLLRVTLASRGDLGVSAYVEHIETDPGTKRTTTTLPDGTVRTVFDNSKTHEHIVVDDHGYAGKSMTLTAPKSTHSDDDNFKTATLGSVKLSKEQRSDAMETVKLDTNGSNDTSVYVAIAMIVALIVATILGATFARENEGHLEFALTKPVGRERLALEMIVADLVGIVGAAGITLVALLACSALFQAPHFGYTQTALDGALTGFAVAFAWYGLLNAATASLKRGCGAVVGFAWPVAFVIAFLGVVPLGDSILQHSLHAIFYALSRIDPISYMQNISIGTSGGDAGGAMALAKSPYVAILAVVYLAITIFQWRKVEA